MLGGLFGSAGDGQVKVEFSPDPGFSLTFDGMQGTEELGRPFLYRLDLSSAKLLSNIGDLIGAMAKVTLSLSAGGRLSVAEEIGLISEAQEEDHYFHGVVTRLWSHGLTAGAYRYVMELRPTIWLLSQVRDCRIFNNMAPFDIITTVLRDNDFSNFEDARDSSSGSTSVEYCVQYGETTLDFITRLMETYGIYYFFKHGSDGHTLVFTDGPGSHKALENPIPFDEEQNDVRAMTRRIWYWSSANALVSGRLSYGDYNFTTPSAELTARTIMPGPHESYNQLEIYEYPGFYPDQASGRTLTEIRLQSLVAGRQVITAHSNARDIHPGWVLNLTDHPDDDANGEYLITRTEWSMELSEGAAKDGGETLDTYRVMCEVIPADVNYRLKRQTPHPMIRGPQTAKVVGAEGEEIDVDEYGRILVRFFWDGAEGIEDADRTCRIRVAQAWAGNGFGTMFIPRVGQEVVVEFMEGNPDRPLVTGVVYNAQMQVPYPLPENKTRSVIKTESSKGGGGYNELRFEDKKDSEEVYFQAQKDYNKVVLNNETVKIKKDTTTTVEEGNRSVTVSKGNDSLTVSEGNRSVTVSKGDASLTVSTGSRTVKINKDDTLEVDTGNRSVKVSAGDDTLTVSAGNHSISVSAGKSTITAAQEITLSVGQNSIKIDTSGITVNGMQVQMSANTNISLQANAQMSLDAKAAMSLQTASLSLQGQASASIQAASVSVTGNADVSVTAPMISLN